MRDKNTPLCLHPLLYTPVWSEGCCIQPDLQYEPQTFGWIRSFKQVSQGSSTLKEQPPSKLGIPPARNLNSFFMEQPSNHTKRVQGNQHFEVPMVQHQDEEGYILFYIFYLKTKQTTKKTTTEEGNEKIKLLFCNAALLAWKVLEQMPCPPLNIHNISL